MVTGSTFNKSSIHPLQSWEWGEFRKEWGNKVLRFQVKSGKVVDSLQLVITKIPKTNLGIGTVLRGPMPTKEAVDELVKIAKEQNLVFVKIEPNYVIKKGGISCADEKKVVSLLKRSGAIPGRTLFIPTTFWVDLSQDEQKLLASFHPKTRYNIRYAQRQGVEVVEDNSDKAFEKYIDLMRETVERQCFYAHSEKYHRLMWKYLYTQPVTRNAKPIAHLLTAKYKGEIITTWILFVWKDFLYYPYGASTDKHKNVMANNLMMWEAIRFGKKLGLKTFDLWGREPGKGFTKFKEGYNPQIVEFLGTWDLVINKPIYYVYRLMEALRWLVLRGKTKIGLIKTTF